ncbi:hypothetical protein DACRYDRAFT_103434 [Dacryopinax primogenitus]|uniref:F-box domain-containing protein n=1 Tax=Dacryopinax primogenitus (strain DJM 731) TaxID=1858805 RepID=M5GH23_DACPD|nr:uncharacterized protein DACRYDRAFT_103434 [Dacryopinax primogenitus]EJU06488.1 hypothetical protein DACRYDRAFT_103434 [Dacryopinax primogenitus]
MNGGCFHCSRRSLIHLPFDCLQHILTYLSAVEIISTLSTCRTLARWRAEESIWRRLCLMYGLSDVSHIPNKSYYVAYTRLLHQYGDLLGLWASDMPYKGNVLEFKLDLGGGKEGTTAGIWGYAWRFPEFTQGLDDSDLDADDLLQQVGANAIQIQILRTTLGVPRRPRLSRMLRIGFELPPPLPDRLAEEPAEYAVTPFPQLTCYAPDPFTPHMPMGALYPHAVQLEATRESIEGYVVSHPYGTSTHPSFPPRQPSLERFCGWYDEDRPMPRLPMVTVPASVDKFHTPRYPVTVQGSPSELPVPAALAIRCAEERCTHHFPAIPFRLVRAFPPLYFPIRATVQHGIAPSDPRWTPESLTGLWLGAYGPHGTEVLYVETVEEEANEWHEQGKMVRATKITGDVNVPRGTWTWMFYAQQETELMSDQLPDVVPDLSLCKLFTGQGMTSSHGFFDGRQAISFLDVAVTGRNTINIDWHDLDHVSTYRRYRGPKV